jgi:hypothetical protein
MDLYLSAFSLGIREELEKASMLKKEAAGGLSGFSSAFDRPMTPMRTGGSGYNPVRPVNFRNSQPRTGETQRMIGRGQLRPIGDIPSNVNLPNPSFNTNQPPRVQPQQPAQPVQPRFNPQAQQRQDMHQRMDMHERMDARPGNVTPIDGRGAESLRSGLLAGTLTPAQVQETIRMMPAHERTQAQMIVAGGRSSPELLTAAQNYDNPRGGNVHGRDYLVQQNNQKWLDAQRAITQTNPLIGKAGTKENAEFLKQYRALAGNNLNQNYEALQGALTAMNNRGASPTATVAQSGPAPAPAQAPAASAPAPVAPAPTAPPAPVRPTSQAPAPSPAPTEPEPEKTGMDLSSMPMNENILPNISKQSKWKYVRTKDGLKLTDGNLVYSFGGFPESFSADDSRVSRLNDDNILDLEKDMTSKGTAQIHRSSPDNIYMTLADGAQNPTFMLQHEEGKNWRYSPSKKFLAKLKAISELSKKENPDTPEVVSVNPESMIDAATDAGVKLANLSMNMTAEDLADAGTGLIEGVKNFGKGFVETHAKKPVTGFLESYLLSKGIGSVRDYIDPKRKIKRLIDPAERTSREVWPLAEAALATIGSRAITM